VETDILADRAREALSKYCIEECKAYCCRKGYLVLTAEETDLLAGDQKEALQREETIIGMEDGKYSFNLNKNGCPCLKDSKCAVHNDEGRPSACKEFPIFIDGKNIRLSPRCYGIRTGLLYPYIHHFLKLGCRINQ